MATDNTDPLNQVAFISVPDEYQHHLEHLPMKAPTMLPVDTGGDPSQWDPGALSW